LSFDNFLVDIIIYAMRMHTKNFRNNKCQIYIVSWNLDSFEKKRDRQFLDPSISSERSNLYLASIYLYAHKVNMHRRLFNYTLASVLSIIGLKKKTNSNSWTEYGRTYVYALNRLSNCALLLYYNIYIFFRNYYSQNKENDYIRKQLSLAVVSYFTSHCSLYFVLVYVFS
jgi:hypothetical protein